MRLWLVALLVSSGVMSIHAEMLFNGKDFTGWYTYIKGRGRNVDPKRVFSVIWRGQSTWRLANLKKSLGYL